jgi:hypothetical protein
MWNRDDLLHVPSTATTSNSPRARGVQPLDIVARFGSSSRLSIPAIREIGHLLVQIKPMSDRGPHLTSATRRIEQLPRDIRLPTTMSLVVGKKRTASAVINLLSVSDPQHQDDTRLNRWGG